MQSVDEAKGLLQTFPDSYKHRFEEEVSLDTVEAFLISMLNKQKQEHIERAFSGLNTHSIKFMLEAIRDLKQPKPTKKVKKCAPTPE